MSWLELIRTWRRYPVVAALVLAVACGGGDGGTGPGGGGALAGTYELVGINEDGLPEEEQVRTACPRCSPTGP